MLANCADLHHRILSCHRILEHQNFSFFFREGYSKPCYRPASCILHPSEPEPPPTSNTSSKKKHFEKAEDLVDNVKNFLISPTLSSD